MSLVLDAFNRQVMTWRWLVANEGRIAQVYKNNLAIPQHSRQRHVDEHTWFRRITSQAPTFAVAADIGDATYAASLGLPDDVVLEPTDVFEPSGFAWAERPFRMPGYVASSGEYFAIPSQGLAWMVIDNVRDPEGGPPLAGVFMMFSGSAEVAAQVTGVPRDDFRAGGTALLHYSIFWRFGDSLERMRQRSDLQARRLNLGDEFTTDADTLQRSKFAYAFWHFCRQGVFSRVREYAPRHVLRQAARLKWPGEATLDVVELRKRRYPDRPAGMTTEEEREWSCRWLVRGHWRRQWYPSLGAHKVIWVWPYVKGPDDKPLRLTGPRVYAAVR